MELDGDPTENLDAFEQVVRCMKESGIGYGSINHPVDRDPVCGYTGIIGDTCPLCGRSEHDGHENFERIRRITGYLVGTVDRFNNAKKAEVRDRVKPFSYTHLDVYKRQVQRRLPAPYLAHGNQMALDIHMENRLDIQHSAKESCSRRHPVSYTHLFLTLA